MREKRFFVLVGPVPITDKIECIIESYKIMGAHIEYSGVVPDISKEFGTFCHIDSVEVIQYTITIMRDIRYIGYINGTDNILSLNCNGFIGIPVKVESILVPDGMREITYPHVRLSPQIGCNKFDLYKDMIGFPINYKISELIKTKHTYSHRVFINEDAHIVARVVLKENTPFISKKEIDGLDGVHYNTYIGYPVIM
jgi:hypothetical protein